MCVCVCEWHKAGRSKLVLFLRCGRPAAAAPVDETVQSTLEASFRCIGLAPKNYIFFAEEK